MARTSLTADQFLEENVELGCEDLFCGVPCYSPPMDAKRRDDQYSPEETQRRMDAALRRALNTPPKPHSEMVGAGKRVGRTGKSRVKKPSRLKD